MTMSQDTCRELLLDLVMDTLSQDKTKEVKQALLRFPECRREYERLKDGLALAADLPLEQAPPDLKDNIMRAVRDEAASAGGASERAAPTQSAPLPPPAQARKWSLFGQIALAATALIGIGIGTSFLIDGAPEPQIEGDGVPLSQPGTAQPEGNAYTDKAAKEEAPAEISSPEDLSGIDLDEREVSRPNAYAPTTKTRARKPRSELAQKRARRQSSTRRMKKRAKSAWQEEKADLAKGAAAAPSASLDDAFRSAEAKKKESAPTTAAGLLNQARLLRKRSNCAEAVVIYEKLIATFPTSSYVRTAHSEAGACYAKLGNTKLAAKHRGAATPAKAAPAPKTTAARKAKATEADAVASD